MKILIACEFSGIVRDAFIARGHDAWSCDILPTEKSGPHICKDIREVLYEEKWDMMIAHPPCTYLTNAGVRWLHEISGSKRWIELFNGAEFFNLLWKSHIPKIAVENPVPHKYAKQLIGNYTQLIRPWQFGNPETKAICLWLKGLPRLVSTNVIKDRVHNIHKEPPGPDRWKNRSRFFPEIAKAMAEQWGGNK